MAWSLREEPMRTRRVLIIGAGLSIVFIVMLVFLFWRRGQVPVGTEERVTLSSGVPSGYVWVDGDRGHYWCLAPGQSFPAETDRWDDGVLHGGGLASGIMRFDSDERATFFGDLDGREHPVTLVRMTTNRYGCHF